MRNRVKHLSFFLPALLILSCLSGSSLAKPAQEAAQTPTGWGGLTDPPELKGLKAMEQAKHTGELLAARAKEAGVESCVFDRGGYKYHGRVKALAEGARGGGLAF